MLALKDQDYKELFFNLHSQVTGITRGIDKLGHVVIPVEYRKILEINDGDSIEILKVGNGLLLKKP